MSVKLGLDAKLFRNTGVYATPTWVEMKNVKDLTLNLEASESDVTTRGNAGWRATIAALKDGSIEFEMVWDTADADFVAIKDAFFREYVARVCRAGRRCFDDRLAGAAGHDDDHRVQPLRTAGRGDHGQCHGQADLFGQSARVDDRVIRP